MPYDDDEEDVNGVRLLLISQVIYEHGETWWNDIDRIKLLIR
jgi:hypothetical protein